MPDRFNGTDNMRANGEIKSGTNTQQVPSGGPDVGGLDSPRADLTIKTNPGKPSGPTSGPLVGGTIDPGTTIK